VSERIDAIGYNVVKQIAQRNSYWTYGTVAKVIDF
jgi:hypothetical protein